MSKLGIGTGITPDDGNGDSLLEGAVKINSNFNEIYSYFGDGTNLTSGSWQKVSSGINTTLNVGIGTTNPRFALEVGAVGSSGTSLYVNGNARVTGILTVGSSSISLDGSNNILKVGTGVTINGSTGIISATSIVLNGSAITGAGVTSITAGSGISVNQSTGNVTITATSGGGSSQWETTSAGIHTLSNVGIGTTNPTSALTVERYAVGTAFSTFTAIAGISHTVDSFTISSTNFKTVEYTVHVGYGSSIQAQKVLAMQNGTTAYSQEYAVMYDSNLLVSIGAIVTSGEFNLLITPEPGVSGIVTYRFTREAMI